MKRKTIKTCLWVTAGALIVWGAGFFIQSWAMLDMEKITALPQSTVVYDNKGQEVQIISGTQDRTRVSLAEIPKDVVNAFLAAEDVRFYSHHGIDPYRMGGALVNNIKSGDYSQGASTITQQLVKLTHLSSDKTIERKAREAILALRLETELNKDEILEAYLNTVYFGAGAYGIDAAARRYMGVGAGELSLSQGALLAGVIKSPSGYAPHIKYDKAVGRRNLILKTMAEYGYITKQQSEEAIDQDIKINNQENEEVFGWFTDEAAEEAAQVLGISYDELLRGGYRLYTTLDASMQRSAEDLFREEANFPASKGEAVQAALVSASADTGEILALVGGRNRQVARGLNRAADMKRQPGSAFKPVSVYAAAVDRYGFLPTSFVDDTKREFAGAYSPSNVSDSYNGLVTLREALSRSLNVACVDLISRIGVNSAMEYAQRAGIPLSDNDRNLSLALGALTDGATPVSLAIAYAPLANGGSAVTPHMIRSIEDANGNTVYEYRKKPERIMSAAASRLVTDMLITAAKSGTARALGELPFAVAAKTGTVGEGTVGNRDAWSVAYTPSVVNCVWMGYDKPDKEHFMPNSVTGSNYPTRLAAKYMRENKEAFDAGEFPTPNSLVTVPIDAKALKEKHKAMLVSEVTPKSYTINELFARSNTPTAVSDVWKSPSQVFDMYVAREGGSVNISFTSIDDYALYQIYCQSEEGDILIAEKSAPSGEQISFDYQTRDTQAGYYVIGLEKTLFAEGIRLAGRSSDTVHEAKSFHWDAEQPTTDEAVIIEQTPLFGY